METRKQIISVFFFALLLFVIYQLARIFSPFFEAFFWALVLAFAFYPLHIQVRKLIRNDTFAALATTTCIVLAVLPPAFLFVVNLITETIDLYQQARHFVTGGGLESLIRAVQSFAWFQYFQEQVMTSDILKDNLAGWLLQITRALANMATASLGLFTKNIFLIALNLLLVIILLFVLVRDGEKIYDFFYKLTPLEEEDRAGVYSKLNESLSGVIRGQLVTSIIQAFLAGLTFFFLGLPAPILFGCLTFLTSMIPITGASTVWCPFAAYLFLTQQIPKAVVLTLIGIFIISMSDNVLKPILIGEKTKIPVFLLFFGIMGGLKVYGMDGVFLGPVFITLFFALIKIYQGKYRHS